MSKRRAKREAEFLQMLRRSRCILYRVCYAFTDRQPSSVDDLYQEIVCNLWCGWKHFRGESDEKTWVYRVALNTADTELRKRRRRERIEFIPLDPDFCDICVEDSSQHKKELFDLIDLLPDDEKKIIFLYLERYSHAEIANIVGTTEDAVKQHIYRIKKKLVTINRNEKE